MTLILDGFATFGSNRTALNRISDGDGHIIVIRHEVDFHEVPATIATIIATLHSTARTADLETAKEQPRKDHHVFPAF